MFSIPGETYDADFRRWSLEFLLVSSNIKGRRERGRPQEHVMTFSLNRIKNINHRQTK